MAREIESNQVTLSGEIINNFSLSYKLSGEGFYVAMLASERLSDTKDIIPITISNRLIDVKEEWAGRFVEVLGQFRSYSKHEGDKNRLILSMFVREIQDITEERDFGLEDENFIFLDGYICKLPIYRKTPLSREIADILLAVNRPYGKTDYIPCIAWGRNARFADGLEVGTRLHIEGRIQSREYQKRISETESETRVAYEVSISKMETVEETEE